MFVLLQEDTYTVMNPAGSLSCHTKSPVDVALSTTQPQCFRDNTVQSDMGAVYCGSAGTMSHSYTTEGANAMPSGAYMAFMTEDEERYVKGAF